MSNPTDTVLDGIARMHTVHGRPQFEACQPGCEHDPKGSGRRVANPNLGKLRPAPGGGLEFVTY